MKRTALAVLLITLVGCRSGTEIAELAEILSGSVDWARGDGELGPAPRGQRFSTGDAVRTSPDGGARIRFLEGGALVLEASTTIRFGAGRALRVDGEVAAEGESAVLELDEGTAELTAGSRVRLGGGGGFEVLLGSAIVTQSGDRVELAAGEVLEIELGRAVVRKRTPPPPDAGPAVVEPAPGEVPPTVVTGTVTGRVRARAPDAKAMQALKKGEHELATGTTVDLSKGARLALVRGDERALILGPARVVVASPDGALFVSSAGRAEVTAGPVDVLVEVPGGRIRVKAGPGDGSRAAVDVARGAASISVESGQVEVTGATGTERLVLGERGALERGGAIVVVDRAPRQAIIAIDAGESSTIHDPAPPIEVRVRFGEHCPAAGVVEVDVRGVTRRVHGERSAIVRLDRGAVRYRLRCIEDGRLAARRAAEGRLTVVRDAGTRPLPASAPRNSVDADGRQYNVLYQSVLPALSFRWPGAPNAGQYTLEIKSARGKTITARGSRPTIALPAGRLGEGTYTYRLTAGSAASKTSRLSIDFDNAAASAYLSSPRPGTRWGPTVHLAGATIEGWAVAVDGKPLRLDAQLRFRHDVPAPSEELGLAIEFSHPAGGHHYYVRRPGR